MASFFTHKVGEEPDNAYISIKKEAFKPAEITKNGIPSQSQQELKAVLPHSVIGYSSGENEILSLPFFKMRFIQYDEYLSYLTNDINYSAPESGLVYLDDTFSQAIFLCNFIFSDEKAVTIFKEDLGIESVKQFRIIIKKHHFEEMSEEYQNSADDNDSVELTTGLKNQIDKLVACSTLHYENEQTQELILDFHLDKSLKEAFNFYFTDEKNKPSALALFQLFQNLILLNQYQHEQSLKDKIYQSNSLYAKGRISTVPWEERVFKFKDFWIQKNDIKVLSKSLSDGEHQFLHTIGLALLYKNTESLFLLDEPETHFNPSWRAKYISTLRKCFEGTNRLPEILITSHSPFIVSDSYRENVLIFKKDDHNTVICERPDFNTFGASASKITMKVFDKTDTIGDFSHSKLREFRKRFDEGEDVERLIKEVENDIGDSMEKILLLKLLFDTQEET
ncbi:MAG: restriction system-associated AAA family ATPase [Thiomicrorhabdus sp.]|nr:restriction system-associated AAA family ATPase [Thiomicrorhabdus sp.]